MTVIFHNLNFFGKIRPYCLVGNIYFCTFSSVVFEYNVCVFCSLFLSKTLRNSPSGSDR